MRCATTTGTPDRRASGNRKHLPGPAELAPQQRPIEARTRVVLAPGRDVLVARHVADRVVLPQRGADHRQLLVLRRFEGLALQPFQFDADRVVVALRAAAVAGLPRVP